MSFAEENPVWQSTRDAVDKEPTLANWDALIQQTEQLITKYPTPSSEVKTVITSTFDELLTKFPLFFGYWKKYISIIYQLDGLGNSIAILNRALDAFPNSTELWIDYFNIVSSDDVQKAHNINIKSQFEIASKFIGNHFLSDAFWDKYLDALSDEEKLELLSTKVIEIPLHQYARYYQQFLDLNSKLNEGRDVDKYNNIFLQTQNYVAEIWPFESKIKQSYFTLSAPPEDELQNWEQYIQFQIQRHSKDPSELNKAQTISVFERALIPLALNVQIWIKYIKWYLSSYPDEFESINAIYKKALNLYFPLDEYQTRLDYCLFLEVNGRDIDEISEVYLTIISGNDIGIIPFIKFHSRKEGAKNTIDWLDKLIKSFGKKSQAKLSSNEERFVSLLKPNSVSILITQLIKLNILKHNHSNAKKLFSYYYKHDSIKSSSSFWCLYYKYCKTHDTRSLNKVVEFIRYESSLPFTVVIPIVQDYETMQKSARLIPSQENYLPQNSDLKNIKRSNGHPGILRDKPEIANTVAYKKCRREVYPMPTFKNVEKANQSVEYPKEE